MQYDYLEQFQELGYAVIRQVLDSAEVLELAAAFDRVYREGVRHPSSFRHQNVFYQLACDPSLGQIVRMAQWPSYFEPTLARYRIDRRLLQVLAPLLGTDLKQIINQLHWKPPGAQNVEFGFHQDIRSRRPRSAYRAPASSYVQTGFAIDPHDRNSGAMTVLPGSHKRGELCFENARRVMDRPLRDTDLETLGIDPADQVDLVLEPGDLALWHLHLIHGSGPNCSQRDRRFYINGYVIAGNCDRGEWAFRGGQPCALGEPVLVHYEDLYEKPEPHYVD